MISSSGDSTSTPMESLPLKILVADDNALNRTLLLQMLEHLGHQADSASNGKEVIAALERQLYDVVLMDVQMPGMNGLTATREIRSRWTLECGPRIVGVTGLTLPEEQEECLNAGMDAFLCKPIRLEKLAEALYQCQLQCQLRSRAELTLPILDLKVLQELRKVGGAKGNSFLNDAIATFLAEAPELLQAIASAHEQQQPQSLEEAAHSLKGMSSSLGAIAFSQLCQELENVGKTGSVSIPNEVLEHLKSEFNRVRQELEFVISRRDVS